MKIATDRPGRALLLRKSLAIAAAGMVTSVLVFTTAGASGNASTGTESTTLEAEAQAVTSVEAATDAKLEVRKADRSELEEIGIQALPSACTGSDGEPYVWGDDDVDHGATCYEAKGDDQWVIDLLDNDARFYVYSETEYGKKRYCGDDTAGWTECKYDHREHECVIFAGYYQHNNYFGWTPWISTTTGDRGCVRD
jgi:hypothetical protein